MSAPARAARPLAIERPTIVYPATLVRKSLAKLGFSPIARNRNPHMVSENLAKQLVTIAATTRQTPSRTPAAARPLNPAATFAAVLIPRFGPLRTIQTTE